MPFYLDEPNDARDLPHGAPVARPVKPVQGALHTSDAEQVRKGVSAFWEFFDRCVANQRIVEQSHLSHNADGVLRLTNLSSENGGESSAESERR